MAKYIIEIEDVPSMAEDGFTFYKCVDAPWWYISDMHINRLKQYEDTKPKTGRWIPCEERLPEEYGEYRITWTTSASKKRFIGDAEFEVTGEWDAKYDRFKGEWLLGDYINAYPDVKVIAWKPLEEPY